jgi:hypothetical protein
MCRCGLLSNWSKWVWSRKFLNRCIVFHFCNNNTYSYIVVLFLIPFVVSMRHVLCDRRRSTIDLPMTKQSQHEDDTEIGNAVQQTPTSLWHALRALLPFSTAASSHLGHQHKPPALLVLLWLSSHHRLQHVVPLTLYGMPRLLVQLRHYMYPIHTYYNSESKRNPTCTLIFDTNTTFLICNDRWLYFSTI